jgi:hypothetical protein
MQRRGRKVVPWFQTAFVVALFMTMTLVLIVRLLFVELLKGLAEPIFLSLFFAVGLFWFFILKKFFFEKGKHISLTEFYLREYSDKKRMIFKILVIGSCLFIPLLIGFFIWYNAI